MTNAEELQIIVPAKADEKEPLDAMLIEITKAIATHDPDEIAHGFLGGEFGYGGHWDDDVFMMHPFCWCEREDCQWCNFDSGHGAPNFWHKASGMRVWWYKWIGRDMEVANLPADLSPILAECLASLTKGHPDE